jgi:hypothetical protein
MIAPRRRAESSSSASARFLLATSGHTALRNTASSDGLSSRVRSGGPPTRRDILTILPPECVGRKTRTVPELIQEIVNFPDYSFRGWGNVAQLPLQLALLCAGEHRVVNLRQFASEFELLGTAYV